MTFKLFNFLSRYDEFGHPVTLNFTKNEDHKTWLGTFLSIVKTVLLAFYLYHIARVCYIRRDPDIQYSNVFRNWTGK